MIRNVSMMMMMVVAVIMGASAMSEVRSQTDGDAGNLAMKVGDAQKANMARLQSYRWRVKSDLQSGGVSKATVVNEISFDAEGKVKAEPISGEATEEQKPGLRGRRQSKELDATAEYLGKVLEQSLAYMFMSKGTLVDMFEAATITTAGDATTVTGKDVYVKGDQVVMTLDTATLLTRRLTFTSPMGTDVINGDVTYELLKDGTNRVTKSVMEVPAKQAKILSDSYDFVKPEN
jgi:hypothetical protein